MGVGSKGKSDFSAHCSVWAGRRVGKGQARAQGKCGGKANTGSVEGLVPAEGALGCHLRPVCGPHLWSQLSDRHGLEEQQDGQPACERDLQLHEGAFPLLQGEGSEAGWGSAGALAPLSPGLLGSRASSTPR